MLPRQCPRRLHFQLAGSDAPRQQVENRQAKKSPQEKVQAHRQREPHTIPGEFRFRNQSAEDRARQTPRDTAARTGSPDDQRRHHDGGDSRLRGNGVKSRVQPGFSAEEDGQEYCRKAKEQNRYTVTFIATPTFVKFAKPACLNYIGICETQQLTKAPNPLFRKKIQWTKKRRRFSSIVSMPKHQGI